MNGAALLAILIVLPATAHSFLCYFYASFGQVSAPLPDNACQTDGECLAEFTRDSNDPETVHANYRCYDFSEITVVDLCSGVFNSGTKVYICCRDIEMCNRNFTIEDAFPPVTTQATTAPDTTTATTLPSNHPIYLGAIIGAPLGSLIILAIIAVVIFMVVYLRIRKKRIERNRRQFDANRELPALSCDLDISMLDEITETSGSGYGMPHLEQRTIARSIKLGEVIGNGRFGQVIVGNYQGDLVAVKKFLSIDSQSWQRETEVYTTNLLTHDNILRYLSSDMISNNGATELWLITQYHPHGSLYDYLNKRTLPPKVFMQMSISICSGLAHLHTELYGTINKAAIAHRDIKSKNILVKNDLRCCIADFGLAVTKGNDNKVNMPTNTRQGTKRYMAPEVLDERINLKYFEAFQYTDVYSLGLVLWEMCRRCEGTSGGEALDYEPPFYGLVPPDPTFDEMKRIVVVEKRQPAIPGRWLQDELLKSLTNVIRECWYYQGEARPHAVYLKKKLNKLAREDKLEYEKSIE